MKIVYYNCEIAEQAVGENQNSCVLAAETSNAYAQRVAQMEQDSYDDAWTEAMKGEVKQNTAENVEEWLKLYESSKKRQARG